MRIKIFRGPAKHIISVLLQSSSSLLFNPSQILTSFTIILSKLNKKVRIKLAFLDILAEHRLASKLTISFLDDVVTDMVPIPALSQDATADDMEHSNQQKLED